MQKPDLECAHMDYFLIGGAGRGEGHDVGLFELETSARSGAANGKYSTMNCEKLGWFAM